MLLHPRTNPRLRDGKGHTGCRQTVNTCSKPSLLFSFSQMAVGAEVGGRWRLRWFGPAFPLYEVGDPALSQRGGLCHMIPHCLRDTWTRRGRCQSAKLNAYFKSQSVGGGEGCYHSRRIWQELQTHGCRHFSVSLLEIFPTLESFHFPQISPARQISF